MMNRILVGLLLIALLAGCSETLVCNEPYIQVGTSCCLDQNSNRICDTDEPKAEVVQASGPLSAMQIYEQSRGSIFYVQTACTYNYSYQDFTIKDWQHRYWGLQVELVPSEITVSQDARGVTREPLIVSNMEVVNYTGTGFILDGRLYTNAHVVTCPEIMEGYYETLAGLNYTQMAEEILEKNSGFDNEGVSVDDVQSALDEIVSEHMDETDDESFEGKEVSLFHETDGFKGSQRVEIIENGTAFPGMDFAVLQLAGEYPGLDSSLEPITIGQEVFVVGFPYLTALDPEARNGSQTTPPLITKGIVGGTYMSDENITYFTVDATASFGSSGSPVLNDDGEVIGILTAASEGDEDLSLILPITLINGQE